MKKRRICLRSVPFLNGMVLVERSGDRTPDIRIRPFAAHTAHTLAPFDLVPELHTQPVGTF